jgi:hypothetical protein
MITTAKQAFTFAAGSVGSHDIPERAIFASVFRGFADLCGDIPCELPRADVVAFALIRLGATDGVPADSQEGKRRLLWHEVGHLLKVRIADAPPPNAVTAFVTDAPASALDAFRDVVEAAKRGDIQLVPAPEFGDFERQSLCEAIWLWQMLATACESRIGAMPPVQQDRRTGQLSILDGAILRPISQLDFRAMQQQHAQLTAMLGGLRQDLKMLIEGLCLERTAEIRRVEADQVAKLQAAQQEAIEQVEALQEKPRLTIVKD